MENPKDRKYTKEHEWIKVEADVGIVGITDHAQDLLTDVVYVELPPVGKLVEKGKAFCVVESVKSVSDVFAPVHGEIIEVNKELEGAPQKINENAFDAWIVKIKISDSVQINDLMDSDQYTEFCKSDH